nr:MAG TPA_asm: hypothetical protein [Caudoviricetes sp.]
MDLYFLLDYIIVALRFFYCNELLFSQIIL